MKPIWIIVYWLFFMSSSYTLCFSYNSLVKYPEIKVLYIIIYFSCNFASDCFLN